MPFRQAAMLSFFPTSYMVSCDFAATAYAESGTRCTHDLRRLPIGKNPFCLEIIWYCGRWIQTRKALLAYYSNHDLETTSVTVSGALLYHTHFYLYWSRLHR